jgi:hypothetical protein
MLEHSNIQQACDWFNNTYHSDQMFLAEIILKEKNPELCTDQETLKKETKKYVKKLLPLEILDELSNIHHASIKAEKWNDYTLDFSLIKYMEQLSTLKIYTAKHYINLNSLNNLHNLQVINFHSCSNLKSFINLKNFNNNITLILNQCTTINLNSFINLNKLESINLLECSNIKFQTNQLFTQLKHILIQNCKNIEIEIDFSKHPNLTILSIQECQGKITFKNPNQSKNLTLVSIPQLGKTPQINKIIHSPHPQTFQLY